MAKENVFELEEGWYVIRPRGDLLKGIDGFPKRFRGKGGALDACCYVSDNAAGCALLYVPSNFAWGE